MAKEKKPVHKVQMTVETDMEEHWATKSQNVLTQAIIVMAINTNGAIAAMVLWISGCLRIARPLLNHKCSKNVRKLSLTLTRKSLLLYATYAMHSQGMTARQISDTLKDRYGFEASEGFISDVTNKIIIQIEDGLSGMKEEIAAAYPKTKYQRCIVH